MFKSVLWVGIGFNADLDPVFYLNADPDQGGPTNAAPCPGNKKCNFNMKNTPKVGDG
jgi:hypothetical protein